MLPTRPIVGFHDVEGRISDAPKIRPCFFATSSVASVRLTLTGCVPAEPASVWPESFRVVSGFLVGDDEGLLRFFTGVVPPVGLHEHGVDLLEIDVHGVSPWILMSLFVRLPPAPTSRKLPPPANRRSAPPKHANGLITRAARLRVHVTCAG